MVGTTTGDNRRCLEKDAEHPSTTATTEYCVKLQQWMWQYYWGYAGWQGWVSLPAFSFPPPCSFPPPGTSAQITGSPAGTSGAGQQAFDSRNWYSHPYPYSFPAAIPHTGAPHTEQSTTAISSTNARTTHQHNGNPPQPGRVQLN